MTIGRNSDALKCFEYCFQIGTNIDLSDERIKAMDLRKILAKMGCVYSQIGEYDRAVDMFHEVIELYYQNDEENKEECIQLWISLADIYKELCDYENALFCYHAAIKIHRSITDDEDMFLADVLEKIGLCQLLSNEYVKATKSLAATMRIKFDNYERSGDTSPLLELRFLLGLAFYYLGDKKNAIMNWEEVMNVNTKDLVENTSHVPLVEKCLKAYLKLGK